MSLITLCKIPISEVFKAFVTDNGHRNKIKWNCGNRVVKIRKNSDRYILFKNKGLKCICCGLEANKAYVEISENDLKNGNTAHINFYHISNGDKVLFTKDHIIPKSLGGKDIQENYQVMCFPCNNKKGSEIV